MSASENKGQWGALIFSTIAILGLAYLIFFSNGYKKEGPLTTSEAPPTMGPMMGARSTTPEEDSSEQQDKIEAAFEVMNPKFQALQNAMRSVMNDNKEPTPEMREVGMFMMQARQYGQTIRILGMTNSPRAQKRLESGLAILIDLVDEAYEEAQQAGLIPKEEPVKITIRLPQGELAEEPPTTPTTAKKSSECK